MKVVKKEKTFISVSIFYLLIAKFTGLQVYGLSSVGGAKKERGPRVLHAEIPKARGTGVGRADSLNFRSGPYGSPAGTGRSKALTVVIQRRRRRRGGGGRERRNYEKSNDNLLIRAGWPILVMVLMSVSLFLAALRSNFLSLKL